MSQALSSSSMGSRATGRARSSARYENPLMDRRAHTERRALLKSMPGVDRQSPRHTILAGCLGVFLGSAGALAVLEPRSVAVLEQAGVPVNAAAFEPATAVMAPLFDTRYFPPTTLKSVAVPPGPQTSAGAGRATRVASVKAVPPGPQTSIGAEPATPVELSKDVPPGPQSSAGADSSIEDAPLLPNATYQEPPIAPGALSR